MELLRIFGKILPEILWGWPVLLLLLWMGIWYTLRLRWFQIRMLPHWIKKTVGSIFSSRKGKEHGVTPFQSVATALAGSIGTGNIVGVATALTVGGPGAIFWMWISALFGMMTSYGEIVLGLCYRKRDGNQKWMGGAMYYLETGLGKKGLATLFAAACTLASLGMGNMTQANAVAETASQFGISPLWSGIGLGCLLLLVLLGGTKRIVSVTETVVPWMSLLYLGAGIVVLFVFRENLGSALGSIFVGAFSMPGVFGGGVGYGIRKAMSTGLSRGIFTNEAGLGSSVLAHAAAETEEPCEQGMWGIFQVFFDTIVVCTITALCILASGAMESGLDGGLLSTEAFCRGIGSFGRPILTVCTVVFAFAAMLGWAYYGSCTLRYLCTAWHCSHSQMQIVLMAYRFFYGAVTVAGSVLHLYTVWDLCGCCNGLMALPNLYALWKLLPRVQSETNRYCHSVRKKSAPKRSGQNLLR